MVTSAAPGSSKTVKRTYYGLMLGTTLAASLIWGINTIFLLDAGLSNLEAFAANAFFTAGMVLFEVPTGIVADMWGRRVSFLLGTVTLAVTTALYVMLWQLSAPFWAWAVVSLLLGLGFTFFSGATEAWLVDALAATGFDGQLESVFSRGQAISGAAMLVGSVAGGYVAQATNLGVPFVMRAGILLLVFVAAFVFMRDLGFTPKRDGGVVKEIKTITSNSVRYGLRVPPVRWLMLSGVFTGGMGIYVFYALQPYLLELYGNPEAYGIAGLVAAIVAGAQIAGGLLAPQVRKLFHKRTSALLLIEIVVTITVVLIGLLANFWVVLGLIVVWGLVWSASVPIRQAYLNGSIPSQQRATILSFDSLMASSGGIVSQPLLGRAADVWGYPTSYVISGGIAALSVPFIALARRENAPAEVDQPPPVVTTDEGIQVPEVPSPKRVTKSTQ